MNILCFDTCFDKSYIVLAQGNKVLQSEQIESNERNYHSVYLIPKIRDILKTNGLFIRDIDIIGVNIGPGSFTGIRAGITIARVLCQQFNIKLIGITSLEILSYLNKENIQTIVVTDARKNKVYFGEYKNGIEITTPKLVDKDELVNLLNKKSIIVADNSIGHYLEEKGINIIKYEELHENLGYYLFCAVKKKLESQNDDFNWAKIKPMYIQKPSISKSKEKINVL